MASCSPTLGYSSHHWCSPHHYHTQDTRHRSQSLRRWSPALSYAWVEALSAPPWSPREDASSGSQEEHATRLCHRQSMMQVPPMGPMARLAPRTMASTMAILEPGGVPMVPGPLSYLSSEKHSVLPQPKRAVRIWNQTLALRRWYHHPHPV